MSVSRGLLKLLNCEGNINLGMIQDYCNGIIETSGQIIINTSRCFEHNIYLKKLDKDNGEFIDEFKSEKPSLYLYCSDLVMI